MRLFTNEAMIENVAFYRRRGFVEIDRAEQDEFNRLYFAKDLPD